MLGKLAELRQALQTERNLLVLTRLHFSCKIFLLEDYHIFIVKDKEGSCQTLYYPRYKKNKFKVLFELSRKLSDYEQRKAGKVLKELFDDLSNWFSVALRPTLLQVRKYLNRRQVSFECGYCDVIFDDNDNMFLLLEIFTRATNPKQGSTPVTEVIEKFISQTLNIPCDVKHAFLSQEVLLDEYSILRF